MAERAKLVKVQFWISEKLRREINEFAQSISLSASDFYKAGAIFLKNTIQHVPENNVILLTSDFKYLMNSELQKKIHKSLQEKGRGA